MGRMRRIIVGFFALIGLFFFGMIVIATIVLIFATPGEKKLAEANILTLDLTQSLPEAPPDHSTVSRTRRLIDLETHEAVFTWMLQCLADAGLVNGKTVGVDATTLEANAALRSIVRRDTGESYKDFLTKLAQASGIETPTRADLDRKSVV